jgi:adenosylcobinamide-GDP ribazoletransferase
MFFRSLIAALRFLTRLPVPGPVTRAEDLPGAVAWFPLVGAGAGAAIGGVFLLTAHWWPSSIAAVVAIAAGLILTGGFHEDAVSDAADGLGGGTSRERVLEIMKDSRLGAYGAMSLWVLLTLRWAVLVALGAGVATVVAFALAGAWGRWTAAPLLRLPPLGATGLGKDVGLAQRVGPLVIATFLVAAATAGAWWWGLPRAPWAALAALAATALWASYLARRLGGQSGDLLGAGNQLAESAVLLTLVAR